MNASYATLFLQDKTARKLPPCQQELRLLNQGHFLRSLKGDLHFLGEKKIKYESILKGKNADFPPLGGLWQGQEIELDSLVYFSQETCPDSNKVKLLRPFVPGSLTCYDTIGEKIPFEVLGQQEVQLSIKKSGTFKYRPLLKMRITELSWGADPVSNRVSWTLVSEEI